MTTEVSLILPRGIFLLSLFLSLPLYISRLLANTLFGDFPSGARWPTRKIPERRQRGEQWKAPYSTADCWSRRNYSTRTFGNKRTLEWMDEISFTITSCFQNIRTNQSFQTAKSANVTRHFGPMDENHNWKAFSLRARTHNCLHMNKHLFS